MLQARASFVLFGIALVVAGSFLSQTHAQNNKPVSLSLQTLNKRLLLLETENRELKKRIGVLEQTSERLQQYRPIIQLDPTYRNSNLYFGNSGDVSYLYPRSQSPTDQPLRWNMESDYGVLIHRP